MQVSTGVQIDLYDCHKKVSPPYNTIQLLGS